MINAINNDVSHIYPPIRSGCLHQMSVMEHNRYGWLGHVVLYLFIYFDSSMFSDHKVFVFRLFRELLSQQQHYDWGLRALKTVLRGCGNLLQAHKQTSGQGKCH